jgi:outer membrane protein assembly factor BamB/mono/diheme cytochrome c family protein
MTMSGWRLGLVAILLVAGMVTVAAPGGAQDSADVPMFRGSAARTGEMPGPGPEGEISELWRYQTGGVVVSSPAVVDGILYVGVWYDREQSASGTPESPGGMVVALDRSDGSELWRFRTGGPVFSSPTVVDGMVCVGSDDGSVYMLDAATGSERWRFLTGDTVSSSPAVLDGVVYIGSNDGNVYALDAATGRERWRVAADSDVRSALAIVDGTLFFNSVYARLYAVEISTGRERWSIPLGDDSEGSPAVANGIVYSGDGEGSLVAVSASTGDEVWRTSTGLWLGSSPAIVNGLLVIAGANRDGTSLVLGFDPMNGSELWQKSLIGGIFSSVALADGAAYFGAGDGNVYALDAATGAERWRFATGNRVVSSPAVVDGVVYVGSMDGNLYAIAGDVGVDAARAQRKFFEDVEYNLSWLTENSSDIPRGLQIGRRTNAGTDPLLPWNAGSGATWSVTLGRGDTGTASISVLGFDTASNSANETQVAIDGLQRQGWLVSDSDRVADGDTCLTYQGDGGARAVCYAVRGLLVIVGVSVLPIDNVDAVLMNAADLVRLGVAATKDLSWGATYATATVRVGPDVAQQGVDLAALGNVTAGQTSALVACNLCHGASKPGGVLFGPGSASAALTDQQLYDTVRLGTNHGPEVGGPGPEKRLTDKDIYNIIAFIRSKD